MCTYIVFIILYKYSKYTKSIINQSISSAAYVFYFNIYSFYLIFFNKFYQMYLFFKYFISLNLFYSLFNFVFILQLIKFFNHFQIIQIFSCFSLLLVSTKSLQISLSLSLSLARLIISVHYHHRFRFHSLYLKSLGAILEWACQISD